MLPTTHPPISVQDELYGQQISFSWTSADGSTHKHKPPQDSSADESSADEDVGWTSFEFSSHVPWILCGEMWATTHFLHACRTSNQRVQTARMTAQTAARAKKAVIPTAARAKKAVIPTVEGRMRIRIRQDYCRLRFLMTCPQISKKRSFRSNSTGPSMNLAILMYSRSSVGNLARRVPKYESVAK